MPLPARRPANLARLLAEVPELRPLIMDGTERPMRRFKADKKQRRDYSGKKKSHRKKNLLVSAEQRVVYLGRIAPGSVHDKKLADRARRCFPAYALLVKDSGLQGDEPPTRATLQPKKKPKSRGLRPYEKAINRLVSRTRIVVEHTFADVKFCRIVADTFRNWRSGLVDEVMLAAAACKPARDLLGLKQKPLTPYKLLQQLSTTKSILQLRGST